MNVVDRAVVEWGGQGAAVGRTEGPCAIGWCPEVDHPLWTAGCTWLGRDPCARGAETPSLEAHRRFFGDRGPWVDGPARHGFRATLVAPARLKAECTPEDVVQFVAGLAARHRAFELPAMQVGWLDGVIALIPSTSPAQEGPLCRLVEDASAVLNPCRAQEWDEPGDWAPFDHRARDRWPRGAVPGAPAWRFHLALSNRLDDPASFEARALFSAATRAFQSALAAPVRFGSVCVFEASFPGGRFLLRERLPLLHA